ncbi:MAG: hypothetical protein J6J17_05635 [Bacilli bacterium]|nr:hypothetical protein [Bacilli bacterium]
MEKIVLCGSMKFKNDIIKLSKILQEKGFDALLPIECIKGLPKEIASRAHFKRIVDQDTSAILVINRDKGDIKNYIGPNTFAEIAFAFYHNKKIFLLQNMYEPYKDELTGWNCICLNNNIDNIDF